MPVDVEQWPPPAPAAMVDHGHVPEWDPPFGMTRARRWTCSTCGHAAIDYCGNVYGSGVTDPCPPAPPAPEESTDA